MTSSTANFLSQPTLSHVLCGLDAAAVATVDDLDAATSWPNVVDIDAAALIPTQEDIDVGNLALLAFAVTAQQSLPPIRVVAVAATHELRILDGHHRACLAALRGERVPAWVVEV
jgi:hypothetical protein